MNCYDCALAGITTAAVAVCTSCGAGVCAVCVHQQPTDHDHTPPPGNSDPHRTRTLICTSCEQVLHATHTRTDSHEGK